MRGFSALFGLGMLGVLALVFTALFLDPMYSEQAEELGISLEVLVLSVGIQSAIILAVSVLAGLSLAPRLGFRSHVLQRISAGTPLWANVRPELKPALGGGLVTGGMLVIGERFAPTTLDAVPEMSVELLVQSIPLRLLYGGITEELLLRWGVMLVTVFLLWKLAGRGTDQPSAGVVWGAIVVAAVLFGVLHLPAAVPIYGTLTTEIIAFIVGLNAIGGIIFGWLFWRYSLEAAIIAHGFAHVVAVAAWLVMLLV